MKEEMITFDVVLNDYLVSTFKYKIYPPHPISERGLYNFVVGNLPNLKGKPFKIRFKGDNMKEGGRK